LVHAREAQRQWRRVPIAERAKVLLRFCEEFERRTDEIALELTWQMGRPIRYAPNEVRGTLERARYMIDIAAEALADIEPGAKENFRRFIRREPLGVVLTIAAWNYPYLIAVNSVVPALMAGNSVILKHSAQTPLCAERFAQCLEAAGLPEGVFQALHLSHADTETLVRDPRVDFIAFTGSVAGGHAVQHAAAERFVGLGLELGGCDPVYVRQDADLAHAVENIVDGAYFNSGQSCCGLQRIYVHDRLYDSFVDGFIDLVSQYKLGNPLDAQTTLGPVVRASAAEAIRQQISATIAAGGKAMIEESEFPMSQSGSPYLAPQVFLNVDHSMPVMREEIFGPVAGIMRVRSDEEAIALINDSAFGLTAAIWTSDVEAAETIGDRVQTGTWFMNRCDYLDPALAWVGVKDSGRGCTLSRVGYEQLTRPKSFHLRTKT
jgi:acyl-CoA reductase-like NAD-dependent aldehyde dehydrogenase